MKLSVIYVWSNCNRGGTLSMPQKLAVIPKNIQSHLQTKSDLHTEGSCLMRLLGLGKSRISQKLH